MTRRIVSIIILSLLLFELWISAVNVQLVKSESKTWTVDDDGPADFSNMEEAVKTASPGDTIWVMPGHYYSVGLGGALKSPIEKPLTLIGHDSILDGDWGISSVIVIEANNVIVKGFTIKGTMNAISVDDCSSVILENNTITDCTIGIEVRNARKILIRNNTICDIRYSDGISLQNCEDCAIIDNSLSRFTHISASEGTKAGIHVTGKRNIVADNLVKGAWHGLYATGNGTTFVGNIIVDSYFGIMDSEYPKYTNNFYIANTIISCEYSMWTGGTAPSFFWNNMINMTKDAHRYWNGVVGYVYPRGGNYWSEYVGKDLYSGERQNVSGSDGIGDTPETQGSYDRYPLMGPVSALELGLWNNVPYHLFVSADISSKILDFNFNDQESTIDLVLNASEIVNNFCRIIVPKNLLWCNSLEEWEFQVNGKNVTCEIVEDTEYTYFYLTHEFVDQNIQIKGVYAIQEYSEGAGLMGYMPHIIIASLVVASIVFTIWYYKKKQLTAKTRRR